MDNIVLLITLTILVFMVVCGYRKGFVKMAFSLISIVLALVLVGALTPALSHAISGTTVYGYVQEKVEAYVSGHIGDTAGGAVSAGVSAQTETIRGLPLPSSVQEMLIENNTDKGYEEMAVDNFASYLSGALTKMIMSAAIYIILFVVIMIAVRVAINLLDLIAKIPGINFLNKTLGTAAGLVEGVVILWILCIILTAFSRTAWAQSAFKEINDSAFLTLIYNTNIFSGAVTGIF